MQPAYPGYGSAGSEWRRQLAVAKASLAHATKRLMTARSQGPLTDEQSNALLSADRAATSLGALWMTYEQLWDSGETQAQAILAANAPVVVPPELNDNLLTSTGLSNLEQFTRVGTDSYSLSLKRAVEAFGNVDLTTDVGVRALNRLNQEALRENLQKTEMLATFAAASASVAQEASAALTEASGLAAESDLAQNFARVAVTERRRAWLYRLSGIIGILLTIGYAGLIAFEDAGTSAKILQRLAVGIPAFLLVAYLASEAAHHRQRAEWADTLTVQLKTLRAYIQDLNAEESSVIRSYLALRTFGPADVKENDASLPGLSGLIERLSE